MCELADRIASIEYIVRKRKRTLVSENAMGQVFERGAESDLTAHVGDTRIIYLHPKQYVRTKATKKS
jgi:hypothetical protein